MLLQEPFGVGSPQWVRCSPTLGIRVPRQCSLAVQDTLQLCISPELAWTPSSAVRRCACPCVLSEVCAPPVQAEVCRGGPAAGQHQPRQRALGGCGLPQVRQHGSSGGTTLTFMGGVAVYQCYDMFLLTERVTSNTLKPAEVVERTPPRACQKEPERHGSNMSRMPNCCSRAPGLGAPARAYVHQRSALGEAVKQG